LAGVAGQPLTAIDECLDRGVLVSDGDAVGFRHDLARLAVEGSLSAAQRARAHAGALAHLTARGSHDHRWLAHHAAGCGNSAVVLQHAPLPPAPPPPPGPPAPRRPPWAATARPRSRSGWHFGIMTRRTGSERLCSSGFRTSVT